MFLPSSVQTPVLSGGRAGGGEGREKPGKPEGVREELVGWMDVRSLLGRDEAEATGLRCERQRQRQSRHIVLESVLEGTVGRVLSGQGAVIPQWDN